MFCWFLVISENCKLAFSARTCISFLRCGDCCYLARDVEGGGGLFWDHFGTILYDLYNRSDKKHENYQTNMFFRFLFASFIFLSSPRMGRGARDAFRNTLYTFGIIPICFYKF